jgi:putative nucleotidyltransferase with HDIG domain
MKAPGTYHHSLMVSNLAEAACNAIGANALLARVGSYYHDIGKVENPEFFTENQEGSSRHEKLTPTMSSLVIINHVKKGIELAKKYKLNKAIIDFIPQHHGTSLTYYFYQRKLEEVKDDLDQVKEESFRYPGPKPQKRETAITLLADSVEAASRTISNPTPAQLSGVVRRIINNKFTDGQLDECDLTLKDLNKIADAFIHVLAGAFHTRTEYPQEKKSDINTKLTE